MDTAGFGVLNAELEKFFMNNGRNLLDNFDGVFPADKKKEFLDKSSGKETKYPLMIANTDQQENRGYTGGYSWIMTKEMTCFFSTRLEPLAYLIL